jgi:nucleotide-binding universal stress UspA family protein
MKLSKVVVGVDYSAASQVAVQHGMNIARRTGASLVLVHVSFIPPPRSERPNDALAALFRERLEAERQDLAALRARLAGQGVEVSQVIYDGDPDEGLADAARELGADLVVVGTHGRTGIKRLTLGSVAEKTVRLASCSVLVSRGDAPAGGYHRIVVGTDFTAQSDVAVDRALELTAPAGTVRVVHAWQPPYMEYDVAGLVTASLREAQELVVAEQRARLLAKPVAAEIAPTLDLEVGSPFLVLDAVPDADLIVVGSHGRRGVSRFLLGSVAEATVRHARCSVLVVR